MTQPMVSSREDDTAEVGARRAPVDLSTRYLGLDLSGPVIASAGPWTRDVERMLALQEAGAAAVVLPSLFQEEVEAEELALADLLVAGEGFAEYESAPLSDVAYGDVGPQAHLRRVEQAKAALSIPVIASVNASRQGEWPRYATLLADSGADAIELNLYSVAADPARGASAVEDNFLRIIEAVRMAIDVPLAVKLSQHFSSLSNFAARAQDAGADALVLFNRFYGADLDLDALAVEAKLSLSTPQELRFPLRWIAILRAQRPALGLAATSGVHSWSDVAKALLVGADVACTTSAVIQNGPAVISDMIAGLCTWMTERDYESVNQLRGSMSAASVKDPAAFERAQYMKVITS